MTFFEGVQQKSMTEERQSFCGKNLADIGPELRAPQHHQ